MCQRFLNLQLELCEATSSETDGRFVLNLHLTELIMGLQSPPQASSTLWSPTTRKNCCCKGAEELALLIQNLHVTLDDQLLDSLYIQDIWSTQRCNLSCIQDPPGVQLYTENGRLTMVGFHLNQFIPASAKYFQASGNTCQSRTNGELSTLPERQPR